VSDAGFVGFARSPKQRDGVTFQEVQHQIELPVGRKVASAMLFSRLNAEGWLGTASKWELGVGSKLVFDTGTLAGQTLVVAESNLPKALTVITESIGELRVTFARQRSSTRIELNFCRWSLPSEYELFDTTSAALIAALMRKLELN